MSEKFFFNDMIDDRECHSKIYWGKDEKGIYYILTESINPQKQPFLKELYEKILGEKQIENPRITDLEELIVIFPLKDNRSQVVFMTNMNFWGSIGSAV